MMRRWFRRKGKEEEERLEEESSLEREELASQEEAAETLPAAASPESREGYSPAGGAEPPEPEAEEETPAAGRERRGLFRRIFKGAETATESEPVPEELIPEAPPETSPALPEAEIGPETGGPVGAGLPRPCEEFSPGEAVSGEMLEEEGPEAERRGMFRRLRERLGRTREALSGGLDRLVHGRKEVDAALLEELEELLITADLGVETSLFLIQALQDKLRRRELADVGRLKAALQAEMVALLTAPPPPERTVRPWVTLLVGVNGVGKTTTIAKLAHRDREAGLAPLLVAADTFRAAAVEQLEIWGERVGAQVIKQKTGSDPAAVVFDGLAAALSRGVDTVYIDTAGRLHTKVNLMEELKKIQRTAAKKYPGAPHEVLLILDATTGQNALSQARLFHEAVGLTGIVLTKMDGTAKGGVALAVTHETGIPLRYIGVGEAMDDLRPFAAEAFVAAILG